MQPNAARRPGWQHFENLQLGKPGEKSVASDLIPQQYPESLLPDRDGAKKFFLFACFLRGA
jgi:hypothetical protein